MALQTPLCTAADVTAYFKFTVDSTSNPSKTEVDSWIDAATALVYGAIRGMYTIPVTDASDLLILKEICVAYVRDKLNYTNGANVFMVPGSNMNVPRTIKYDSFEKAIQMLKNETIVLSSSAAMSARVQDYNSANGITAVAEKGVTQW